MRIKALSFVLVALAVVLALPVASGTPVQSFGTEFEAGTVICNYDQGSGIVSLSVNFAGTIPLSGGGGPTGGLVSSSHFSTSDECPDLYQSAKDQAQALGCTPGPIATGFFGSQLQFACHGTRTQMIRVISLISEGVLTGEF